jgi:hypothetical protein
LDCPKRTTSKKPKKETIQCDFYQHKRREKQTGISKWDEAALAEIAESATKGMSISDTHRVGDGMQQALAYAETLDIPFIFSSNGDGFLFHDRTGTGTGVETEIPLNKFPSPEDLWQRYCKWKGFAEEAKATVETPYYDDGTGRTPRYYQANAINRTIEAVAKGQERILLVMATGTGKTYTAFQIIWRLCPRVLARPTRGLTYWY